MDIEILNERENPLLNRKEVKFTVRFDSGIPRFREIRKLAVSKLKSDDKLTVLDGLDTEFGMKSADCYVKVYKDEDSLMRIEPEFRRKKNFEVKEEKKEEGAAAPEADAPEGEKETPPEETKVEEKKSGENSPVKEEEKKSENKKPEGVESLEKAEDSKTPEDRSGAEVPEGEKKEEVKD